MATNIIKSYNSDNQAEVTADHELKITGNINATNPSVGTTEITAPTSATEIAGIDSSGNLIPVLVTSDGKLIMEVFDGGFSQLSPGYPTQISVGNLSTLLFPANTLRKYAHIANNSSAAIFIQYAVDAALNQGIKIGPGGFYTLDVDNLWRGDVNAIGLMSGQLIDVLEGI